MKRIWRRSDTGMWTLNLLILAGATFLMSAGEGAFGGVRTNFLVDTLGLTSGQVLKLEGIREIPGLALMFIAALAMHLPLARQAAVYLILLGIGYALESQANSYGVVLSLAVMASLGMHGWMPLRSALTLALSTKEQAGRTLGALNSVGALAAIAGMGMVTLISRVSGSIMPTLERLGSFLPHFSLERMLVIISGSIIVLGGLLLFKLPKGGGASAAKPPRMLIKRRYWLFYVLTFFEGSRKEVLNTFGSLVLVSVYQYDLAQISLLLMISSVVNLVLAPVMGYMVDKLGERATLAGSYTLLVGCCLSFAIIRNPAILAVMLIVIRLLVLMNIGLNTYVNRLAPSQELTPTLSAGISINHITSVGMPLVAAALLPVIGYNGIFLGPAGLIAASIPFTMMLRRPVEAPIGEPMPALAK